MKAVAVPYIIALILGVAVIGIVGYWFISQSGKTISVGTKAECDSLCVLWRNSGFNTKPVGLDKCSEYSQPGGTSVCAVSLGCDFLTDEDKPCESGKSDYGPTKVVSGKKVCCKS